MKTKLLLTGMLSATLLLGACSNDSAKNKEEDKKEQVSKLSADEQDKKYKKESKKLGKILAEADDSSDNSDSDISDFNEKDFKDAKNELKKYKDNTKYLTKTNKEVGDYAYKTGDAMLLYAERTSKLEKFKKDNPDLKDAYDIANADATYTLFTVLESIQMDYEDLDTDYKKEYLGAKGNEGVTNLLALQQEASTTDIADGMGVYITEYKDNLTSKQTKELSNKSYRSNINKDLIHEEADMSKRDYNSIVKDFNEKAPEFVQYDEVNKMVSTTEYNYMMDLRNGVVGADTDSSSDVDDIDSDNESSDSDFSSDEPVTRDNVIDKVEEYEGEPLDTDKYTYKEPEKTDDGEWGFSFTDKNGDLAGSYIVDKDGTVTKYDEDGEEE